MAPGEGEVILLPQFPINESGISRARQQILCALQSPQIILIAACSVLWLWSAGLWDLNGPDEGRYVQIAKELLQRDNWLLLTVNGEPYDQKPPLPFWIFALMLKLSGGEVSAWAMRLPSVLAGIITVLCVHGIARTLFTPRTGLLAGLIFLSSPLVIKQAPTVRLDMLFTAWIAIAHWSWLTARETAPLGVPRILLFWFALLAAFFTKGPISFILVLAPPLCRSLSLRSWAFWRGFKPMLGLTASLVLIIGWLVAEGFATGHGFVVNQIASESLGRVANDSHAEPIWYYLKSLFGGVFMPWILLFPFMIWHAWKTRTFTLSSRSAQLWFWIAVPLFVFHLATGKRHQYVLPLVPPLAILAAAFVDQCLWNRPMPRWGSRAMALLMVTLTCITGVLFFLAEERVEFFWERELYPTQTGIIVLVLFGLFLILLTRFAWKAQSLGRGFVLVACVMIGAGFVLMGAVQSALSPRNSSRLLSASIESLLLPNETSIAAIGNADKPKYHIYGSYRIRPTKLAKNYPASPELPRILIAEEDEAAKFVPNLQSGGYEPRYKLMVDDDPMVLFEKPHVEQPVPTERVRFALVGDTGTGDSHAHAIARRITALHDKKPLDAFFMLGDNIYADDPFPASFLRCIVSPFEPLLRRRVPFHAVLGNHDFDDSLEAQMESPILGLNGRQYYTVHLGDLASIFMLCSDTIDKDPEQREWFRREVAASNAPWKIVMLHEPLDASDIDAGSHYKSYAHIKDILTGPDGVDLVFAGHNHVYERRKPLDGVTHITIGLGGKLTDDEVFPPDPGRIIGYNRTRGFGWIELTANELTLHVVSEHGNPIDTASFQSKAI